MIKFLSSYLLLFSCITHFFCCGIPFILGVTSLTSILGYSTLIFFDFSWFEKIEIQLFIFTSCIFIILVFTQLKNKGLNSSTEKLFINSSENTKNKLIARNIYISSSFYFFNLLIFLTELFL